MSLSDFTGFHAELNVVEDNRHDYGEARFQARGRSDGKGFCVISALTDTGVRFVGFRRAPKRRCAAMSKSTPPADFDDNPVLMRLFAAWVRPFIAATNERGD